AFSLRPEDQKYASLRSRALIRPSGTFSRKREKGYFGAARRTRWTRSVLFVVQRRLLARERVELADRPRVVRPVAGQVGMLRVVLPQHALGVLGQGLVAEVGVRLGQQGHGIVLELAL